MMLLRRVTEHVKAQNWFAVAPDYFIRLERECDILHELALPTTTKA